MNAFNGGCRVQRLCFGHAEKPGGFQDEKWPEALAPAQRRVPHRVRQPGRHGPSGWTHKLGQAALDGRAADLQSVTEQGKSQPIKARAFGTCRRMYLKAPAIAICGRGLGGRRDALSSFMNDLRVTSDRETIYRMSENNEVRSSIMTKRDVNV